MNKEEKIKTLKNSLKSAGSEKKRRNIIASFYKIIKEGAEIKVFNDNLQKDIYITHRSVTETKKHAAKSITSTNAVFELINILKNARKASELPVKQGTKSQEPYKKIILLRDNLKDIGEVKLTVGVLQGNNKHVQYCLTAIE